MLCQPCPLLVCGMFVYTFVCALHLNVRWCTALCTHLPLHACPQPVTHFAATSNKIYYFHKSRRTRDVCCAYARWRSRSERSLLHHRSLSLFFAVATQIKHTHTYTPEAQRKTKDLYEFYIILLVARQPYTLICNCFHLLPCPTIFRFFSLICTLNSQTPRKVQDAIFFLLTHVY